MGRRRSEKMADDATRTSTTSLEDDDDQRYLDDAAWARREDGYRQQIKALEEQHKTLKNAWSDTVRTNLLKVDELKRELETKQDRERNAYDLYGSGALVYREKTETGSYRIKRETVSGGGLSRQSLLDMRTKKTSDKYC